jgi:stage III sporulation protein AB
MAEMIAKIAGALCVLAAAAAYGESKARALEQRVQQLQQLLRSLKLLAAEISYARSLLGNALNNVAGQCNPPVGDLYACAAELLSAGPELTAREAWEEALRRTGPQTSFSAADREIIKSLGVSLGVSQQEGQLKQIQLAEQHLSFALEGAREDRERQARLWRYLGFIGGAALVILLL